MSDKTADPFGFTDEQYRDPRYFCWEFFCETEHCVHCMYGDEAVMWHVCQQCHPGATQESGPWTWGWRGQCVRCMPAVVPWSDQAEHAQQHEDDQDRDDQAEYPVAVHLAQSGDSQRSDQPEHDQR